MSAREELLARARQHMWAAWQLSSEELASQAAETLIGLGMLVPEGGAQELEQLRARVAELEAERHVTNEALSDAAEALRADRDRFETLRALCDAAEHVGIVSGGWFTVDAVRRAAAGVPLPKPDGITRRVAPVQSLRCEDEFGLRRSYRTPHDLPELGGQR